MLKSINCPVTNCFFTHNREYLSNVKDFDAILFHGAEVLIGGVPPKRSSEQLYVYSNLEYFMKASFLFRDKNQFYLLFRSPFLSFENLGIYSNFYNMTMTYRFDSDIQWHYGSIYNKQTNQYVAPSKNPKWREPEKEFFGW